MRSTVTTGAIVFSDMVGSTELRSRLGADLAEELRRHHDRLLADTVAAYHGEVLRWTGDGMKAAFATASDAVGAAIGVQRAVAEYARSDRAVAPFQVRVGVAAGEVLVEGGDHHGLPVIEAARLEALARPGEILATGVVRALAGRRAEIGFESLGDRTLKGLVEPVEVHRVVDRSAVPLPGAPHPVADRAPPLVGRDAQLACFAQMFAEARSGRAGLLVVRASPGHGRSRLVAEYERTAIELGAMVIGGTCTRERAAPYEPIAEALGRVIAHDEALQQAVRDPSVPLARLFPGSTSAATEAEPGTARLELFDEVTELLRRCCRRHPVVLTIDDLHGASEPTVVMLRYVCERLAGERLLVVVTLDRGAAVPLGDGVGGGVGDGVGDGGPNTITTELAPFDGHEVFELARRHAPELSTQQVAGAADALLAATGGSPAFVSVLLDHVLAGGRLDGGLGAHGPNGPAATPPIVHDAVLTRLDGTSPDLRDLLTLAAVIGEEIEPTRVAAVSGRSDRDVVGALEDAVRAGVVAFTSGRYHFSPSIVRRCLLELTTSSSLAALHARVAEALETRADAEPDEIARHWRRAGDGHRAIAHLMAAARRDMVALAFESAHVRYQEIVELLARDPAATVTDGAEAWLGLGAAGRALGDLMYPRAVARAARLARSVGDVGRLAEAAALSTWPGTFFFIAEEPDVELIEVCRQAIEVLEPSDPMRVRVLATLASHLTFGDDGDERRRLVDEGLDLATRHDDPMLLASVLNAEFICLWEPATLERRERIGRDLGRIARATGDAEVAFLSAFFQTYCTAERGHLADARGQLSAMAPIVAATRNRYFEFLTERLRLSIDLARCEPDTASRVDDLAARYANTMADTEGTWPLQVGFLALQAGRLGDMVGTMQAMTAGPKSRTWLAALALARLHAGDVAGAAASLAEQGDVPRNYFWSTVAQVQADVAATVGDVERCQHLFDELAPYRGRVGINASGSLCYGLISRSLGALATALGRHDDAVELLTEAIQHADREAMVFEAVTSRRLLASALRALGRTDEAGRLVDAAAPVAAAHGFARETALLAGIGA